MNPKTVAPGLYRVTWKESAGGGQSLASVGLLHDGTRWLAPTNWVSETPSGIATTNWSEVESVELALTTPPDVEALAGDLARKIKAELWRFQLAGRGSQFDEADMRPIIAAALAQREEGQGDFKRCNNYLNEIVGTLREYCFERPSVLPGSPRLVDELRAQRNKAEQERDALRIKLRNALRELDYRHEH